jgi:hypothetical protein
MLLGRSIHAREQRSDLCFAEAIEKKVGNDKVEWRLPERFHLAFERIRLDQANMRSGRQPMRGLMEHLPARVH